MIKISEVRNSFEDSSEIKNWFKSAPQSIRKYFSENKFSVNSTESTFVPKCNVPAEPSSAKMSKYELAMDSLPSETNIGRAVNEIDLEAQLCSELEIFANSNSQNIGDSFWLENKNKLPILFAIYQQLKSVSPSNAGIERLFSKAKLVFSDQRQKFAMIESFLFGSNCTNE